jgi:RNA polymerase sigma factor (sigma-70 family)
MVPSSLSDASLVARCRHGDESAWCELVERFSRYVYAITTQAFRLPREDAEDVFQEVFTRTYQHLGTLQSDEAIRPWIGQLTRRLAIDRLRAGSRERAEEEIEASVEQPLATIEEALDVRDALATLSDSCREILDRFFCRDESYASIASALALPPGTIASRISRCLARLRAELEGRNVNAGPSQKA